MEDSEKLEILKKAFEEAGLSWEGYKHILKRKRDKTPLTIKDGQIYKFCQNIKPMNCEVLPSEIENGSYGEHDSLLDWYMYENQGSNPLVFENVGGFKFDIKKSIHNMLDANTSRFQRDLNGKTFFNGDGNHRILSFILRHLIESECVKTKKEFDEINDHFTLFAKVDLLHKRELVELIEKEYDRVGPWQNSDSDIPLQARVYRANQIQHSDYVLGYDEKSKIYSYNFNGVTKQGREEEIINFLESPRKNIEGVMAWEHEGHYYLSVYNHITKTKNKEVFLERMQEAEKSAEQLSKYKNDKVLIVKDLDKEVYEVISPNITIEDIAVKNIFQIKYQMLLELDKKDFLNRTESMKEVNWAMKFSCPMVINERHYKNVSKENCSELIGLLRKEQAMVEEANKEANK